MPEFTKAQLQSMDQVIQNSTGSSQRAEAAAIEAQIFGQTSAASSQPVVANSAVLAANSAVGKAPSKITVNTIAINPTTGMPYSAAALASGASKWLSNITPAGGITNMGGIIHYDGLAGSVQLPAGVRPQVTIPSVNDIINGTADGGPVTRYNLPYAEGSVDDRKNQARLSPSGALAFADGGPAWPRLTSLPAEDQAKILAEGGSPQDILSLHALPAPRSIVDPITKQTVTEKPSTGMVAPVAAPPKLFAGTNGYVYMSNETGGFTHIGVVNPNLSPSEQYALAAAKALASQPNGNVNNTGNVPGRSQAFGATSHSLGGMPG